MVKVVLTPDIQKRLTFSKKQNLISNRLRRLRDNTQMINWLNFTWFVKELLLCSWNRDRWNEFLLDAGVLNEAFNLQKICAYNHAYNLDRLIFVILICLFVFGLSGISQSINTPQMVFKHNSVCTVVCKILN